jgi:hypothetical protein
MSGSSAASTSPPACSTARGRRVVGDELGGLAPVEAEERAEDAGHVLVVARAQLGHRSLPRVD